MKAELIAVGTEILTGQIVNTNAQFLSEKCAELGIDVYFHTAVGDNEQRLLSVLEVARQRSDLVILCGGLGPTEDDLTKQILATFLGRNLVFDELAMAKLDRFFASRPGRVRTPNNERQAQIVEGSQALQNRAGYQRKLTAFGRSCKLIWVWLCLCLSNRNQQRTTYLQKYISLWLRPRVFPKKR